MYFRTCMIIAPIIFLSKQKIVYFEKIYIYCIMYMILIYVLLHLLNKFIVQYFFSFLLTMKKHVKKCCWINSNLFTSMTSRKTPSWFWRREIVILPSKIFHVKKQKNILKRQKIRYPDYLTLPYKLLFLTKCPKIIKIRFLICLWANPINP